MKNKMKKEEAELARREKELKTQVKKFSKEKAVWEKD